MSDYFFSPKQPLRYYNLQVTTTLITPSVSDVENDSLCSIPSDQVRMWFSVLALTKPLALMACPPFFTKLTGTLLVRKLLTLLKLFLLMAIC